MRLMTQTPPDRLQPRRRVDLVRGGVQLGAQPLGVLVVVAGERVGVVEALVPPEDGEGQADERGAGDDAADDSGTHLLSSLSAVRITCLTCCFMLRSSR